MTISFGFAEHQRALFKDKVLSPALRMQLIKTSTLYTYKMQLTRNKIKVCGEVKKIQK